MSIFERLFHIKGKTNTTDIDNRLEDFSTRYGIDVRVLKAILEVESKGSSFDGQGRLVILPEKHIFYRELKASGHSLRAKDLKVLISKSWSRDNYKGLESHGSRWDRLEAMVAFDETAALRSCSYGSAQIMGFNHKLAGFDNVHDFVVTLARDEAANVKAFLTILINFHLLDALKNQNWRAIARRYNGPGQVDFYAGRMAAAYIRLCVADGKNTRPVKSRLSLSFGASGYRVASLQKRLNSLGYAVDVDSDFGPATRAAVLAFQADNGLKTDGVVGVATEQALDAAPVSPVLTGRADKTVKDIRDKGSETLKVTQAIKTTSLSGAVLGVPLAFISENGDGLIAEFNEKYGLVTGLIDKLRSLFEPFTNLIADYPFVFIGLLAFLFWDWAKRIEARRLDDYKKGRRI